MIEEILTTIAYSPLTWAAIGLAFVLFALKLISDHAPGAKAPPVIRLSENPGLNRMGWLAMIMSPVWLVLILVTIWSLYNLIIGGPAEDQLANRVHYLAFVGLMGALGGLVTLPFTLVRAFTTERQTRAQETGLITDRINKAVENLGATRTKVVTHGGGKKWESTEPNIEVRIGAIHALARIGREDLDFHVEIMEILCAYVRHNAPRISSVPVAPAPKSWNIWPDRFQIEDWESQLRSYFVSQDIQIALAVLGSRSSKQIEIEAADSPRPFAVDLGSTCLIGANLSGLDFSGASFVNTQLHRANLSGTNFTNANLKGAHLFLTNCVQTKLGGSQLLDSRIDFGVFAYNEETPPKHFARLTIRGSIFKSMTFRANLHGINFEGSDIEPLAFECDSMRDVSFAGTRFWSQRIEVQTCENVSFDEAHLLGTCVQIQKTAQNVTLKGAGIQRTSFRVPNGADIEFDQAFGDASVELPPGWVAGKGKLSHWSASKLDRNTFLDQWRDWQRANDCEPNGN